MFEKGDIVSYGTTGVCLISGYCVQKVRGENRKYLVLKPVYSPNSTVYVPLDNEKLLSKLKSLMTFDEAHELIDGFSDAETEWIESDAERSEEFGRILENGTRQELAHMVRSLYVHRSEQLSKGKHLRSADEMFFRSGEKLLFEELAAALGTEPDKVLDIIAGN